MQVTCQRCRGLRVLDTVPGENGMTLWHWRCVACGACTHGVEVGPYRMVREVARPGNAERNEWRKGLALTQRRAVRQYTRVRRRADPMRVG